MATSARRWPEATYTYDSNGNLTTKTEGTDVWGYEWNAENRLSRVTRNSVEQARFGYDPLGRRVEKVAGGITTSYTYDGEDIVREAWGASTFKYVHGPRMDEPLAREDATGGFEYYQTDGLGSVVKRTSQAGAVAHEYRYDAWGNIETGAAEAGFAFVSRDWDPEISLAYYRARYYDSRLGRFISEDPIGFMGGRNFYSYVGGAPTTWTDPFGLAKCLYTISTHILYCWSDDGKSTAFIEPPNMFSGEGDAGISRPAQIGRIRARHHQGSTPWNGCRSTAVLGG